ncbi:MAG: hypothetical protein E7164_04285 [Firmicutes bacterium]|nr:hypothetical protein [Bacillota bacterium]
MKKNLGLIILITVLALISVFLVFIVISKHNISGQTFNLKEGDVVNFDEYGITATILNIGSTLCDNKDTCISKGEVEVSIKVEYNENITNYTLQTVSNPEERIKKSNYYITLTYDNEKLALNVTEK